MKYKAILFDLDGTAITNAQHAVPSKRLVEAVSSAKQVFKLSAATGRPISNAKHLLEALDLVDPCVISAGTEVVNPKTDEILPLHHSISNLSFEYQVDGNYLKEFAKRLGLGSRSDGINLQPQLLS